MAFARDEPVATCEGCSKPILSGDGVAVAADGTRWHPACRAKARDTKTKTEMGPAGSVQAAPKRRGRPPRVVVADAAESVTQDT